MPVFESAMRTAHLSETMLILLPALSFCFIAASCRESGLGRRKSLLVSSVVLGACLAVGTELLSVVNQVTRAGVAFFWLVVCAGAVAVWMWNRRHLNAAGTSSSGKPFDPVTRALFAGMAVLTVLITAEALLAPPNTWDAMEYHLPRVVLWMSDHNVRNFATPDYAQVVFGPWAEYAMLHLDLLWGSDRLVNFVELFSYLLSIAGVSLIAKHLGAVRRGQVLAALAAATIPEVALEASGPMNTLVASYWIVATVLFLLLSNEDPSWLNTVCVGLAAGLAILTKGSAYVYLPLLVLACWLMGSWAARVRFLKRCFVFLLLILALNGPQYARAYQLTGSPLGLPFPDGGPRLQWMVQRVSFGEAAANILRGLSIHTVTPSAAVNKDIEHSVRAMIGWIGQNPDDPGSVWPGRKFELNNFSVHEIHAGNPLHLLLFVVAIGILVWKRRKLPAPRATFWYASGIVASFVFFSALLRWQIWESRHHAPLFLLGAAVIALALEYGTGRWISSVIAALLLAYALCFVMVNRTRALVPWSRVDDIYHPRNIQYFGDQHENRAAANIAAAQFVNQLSCRHVAIDSFVPIPDDQLYVSPKSFFVYPLFAMIHADGRHRDVWYEGVHNLTAKYAATEPHPAACAVVCLDCAQSAAKWAAYRNAGGRAAVFDYIVVFSARGSIENDGVPKTQP
jgi:hypothetical protein